MLDRVKLSTIELCRTILRGPALDLQAVFDAVREVARTSGVELQLGGGLCLGKDSDEEGAENK